ncbi:hypothetical protein V6Z12_D04G128700 [Gossypium hirsutum]
MHQSYSRHPCSSNNWSSFPIPNSPAHPILEYPFGSPNTLPTIGRVYTLPFCTAAQPRAEALIVTEVAPIRQLQRKRCATTAATWEATCCDGGARAARSAEVVVACGGWSGEAT